MVPYYCKWCPTAGVHCKYCKGGALHFCICICIFVFVTVFVFVRLFASVYCRGVVVANGPGVAGRSGSREMHFCFVKIIIMMVMDIKYVYYKQIFSSFIVAQDV